jgi:uncharacterized membrane protein
MSNKKNCRYNTKTKRWETKRSYEEIPKKTIIITLYALKWFFFLIILFITAGLITIFLIGSKLYTQMILIYSIAGFLTFFMGYLGWILAHGIMDTLSKTDSNLKEEISHYTSNVDK